jgi:hypothetical protein
VIFTRQAARIILDNYRTGWSTENRLIFCLLSGIDIGLHWCFRGSEQPITADWHFDTILARHGLASLALTPSLATMLDQDIAAQGLKMADGRYDLLRNDKAFASFVTRSNSIRTEYTDKPGSRIQQAGGTHTYFPHQLPGVGAQYTGDWRLKWCQGFGPFVWEAAVVPVPAPRPGLVGAEQMVHLATAEVPILGPCEVLLGGTGRARVTDTHSGYSIVSSPADAGQGNIMQVSIPSGVSYRTIRVEAFDPGLGFYGIRTREAQPWRPKYEFDHACLPPCS